jgi:hypothetical protein
MWMLRSVQSDGASAIVSTSQVKDSCEVRNLLRAGSIANDFGFLNGNKSASFGLLKERLNVLDKLADFFLLHRQSQ